MLAAGIVETARGTRLLARELFLAQDGKEYIPGTRGYRALTPTFIAEVSDYCAREKLCYLAAHSHGGRDRVSFSPDDLASHERGYPALLDILDGGPMGALVFAENAVAGDIWTRQGHFTLDHLTVIGPRVRHLYPAPPRRRLQADLLYDRHARLFGDVGQEILANLKVGIIGLGGGGSLVSEWLARLGVGHLVAVDFDRVELTNLPRIVGATPRDACAPLARQRHPWFQALGKRLSRHKVQIAKRVARQANPRIHYDAVIGNVLDEETARLLRDVDFLFLASDSMQSRLVFSALVHQYLIPGIQIGAKVAVDRVTSQVGDIFTVTRSVLPHPDGGCLHCHELISAGRLQEEALTEGERRAQRYVEHDDVAEPSVIILNALSAAPAVNEFMMIFTGLYLDGVELHHQMNFVRERQWTTSEPRHEPFCLDCSDSPRSRRGRGDRGRLPCRMSSG